MRDIIEGIFLFIVGVIAWVFGIAVMVLMAWFTCLLAPFC